MTDQRLGPELRRTLNTSVRRSRGDNRPEDEMCICTHPLADHNANDLCVALPGALGCGCLGFLRPEDYQPYPH